MNGIKLISTKKDSLLLLFIIVFIFLFNIFYEYSKYKDVVEEEIYSGDFRVLNIYDKSDYIILKLRNDNFSFFTSINKNQKVEKYQKINIAFLTVKIDFLSYLKGFYTKSIYFDTLDNKKTFKYKLYQKINYSHDKIELQELFNALFLAIPVSIKQRDVFTNYGISHLIAISGFHLGVIFFVLYWILYFPYSYFHQKYFPYRNKRLDIMAFILIFLFFYLLLTNLVPSLLRAFIMFVLGIIFLRSNIKVFSFQTLVLTLLIICALFPKYLFSISLWFSIAGVFYIFLYIQYFKNLPKIFSFFLFNFWIFLVFNPIVHYFFYNTTYEQLLSPFITLVFTLFYPFELFLHFINYGDLFDSFLMIFLNHKMISFEVITPFWFFILFIIASLYAIFDKKVFVFLNILLIGFNIYLYH